MLDMRDMAEDAALCHKRGHMQGYMDCRGEILRAGVSSQTLDRWLIEAGVPKNELYPHKDSSPTDMAEATA